MQYVAMNDASNRNALFISHANPEDNAFTLWLGARLAAAGYEVWADVLRLRGGHDWQRILEDALRNKARKVLFVGSPNGARKQGVRNEIQIAHNVGKRIEDAEFIIPLRVSRFDAPFLIAHAQYIDFESSWATGFAELLETLENTYRIPRSQDKITESVDHWRAVQLRHAKRIIEGEERLISNWLSITELPDTVAFYDFRAGISIDASTEKMSTCEWPLVPYHRGFLSFADLTDLEQHFGPELPLFRAARTSTADFLDAGWEEKRIERFDARNQFSNLVRQAFERLFRERGLQPYEMANEQYAWWANVETIPRKQFSFNWPDGLAGRRQLTGYSKTRGLYWHYGVSVRPRVFPHLHVKFVGRVIFSEDGERPIDSASRMHRLRRSFCRSWRNPKWRDMLLTFVHWLADDGNDALLVPVGANQTIAVRLPASSGWTPFAIATDDDDQVDVDSADELDVGDADDVDIDEEFLLHSSDGGSDFIVADEGDS